MTTGKTQIAHKYTFLVTSMELPDGVADQSSNEVKQSLNEIMGQLSQPLTETVQSVPQGPLEGISHSVTQMDRHLVVTILLRAEL